MRSTSCGWRIACWWCSCQGWRRHSEHEGRADGDGDIFVLNKADREGADRLEQQLLAIDVAGDAARRLALTVVRTVASENKGIEELAAMVGKFQKHFESSGERRRKHVEHWKNRLVELLEIAFA